MNPQDPLKSRLQNFGRALGGNDRVVNAVMSDVAGAEFSPSPRAVRRRTIIAVAVALAACSLAAVVTWEFLPGTPPSNPIVAQSLPQPDSLLAAGAGSQPAPPPSYVRGTSMAFALPYEQTLLRTAKWGYIDPTGKVIIEPAFQQAEAFSQGLAAVRINDRWGYINTLGKTAIKPQYDAAEPFSDGLAAVRVGGGGETKLELGSARRRDRRRQMGLYRRHRPRHRRTDV